MTAQDAATLNAPDQHVEGPGYQPRQLVLLGAGPAHLEVLASLATRPLIGVRITLVMAHPRQTHPAMLPGFVAGHYALEDCAIPLEPLVRRGGVRWLQRSAKALDADQKVVTMDDGSTLAYDWLSINTDSIQSREQAELTIPGARTHGLFVRPYEAFGALWPRVVEMGVAKALRIAVIGAGATGLELACAIRHRLPNSAVTLVTGPLPLGAEYSEPVQQRVHAVLKKRGITVLQDVVTAIEADEVRLGCGASLACDVPLLANGVQAPPWLARSGLALDAEGFVAVNPYQQSTSHSNVFAAGEVCTREDHPLPRNAVYAAQDSVALQHNLAATIAGLALKEHRPPERALHLLTCGGRTAIGTWGKYVIQGHWVWWLKNWIDLRFVAKYRSGKP